MNRFISFILAFLTPLIIKGQEVKGITKENNWYLHLATFFFVINLVAFIAYFIKRKRVLEIVLYITGSLTPFGGFLMMMFGEGEVAFFGKLLFIFGILSFTLPAMRKPI